MPSPDRSFNTTAASVVTHQESFTPQTSSTQITSKPPTPPKFGLGGIVVKEESLKVDFALADKYQGFSAELVRLTLLGIAAFGFLFKEFATQLSGAPYAKGWFSASILLFACSTAAALFHRYYSTDSMACQIRYLRLKQLKEMKIKRSDDPSDKATSPIPDANVTEATATLEQIEQEKNDERDAWHQRLNWSEKALAISTLLLSAGAFCLAVAFTLLLF